MHILLLGSGGREHALAWKIVASPLATKLWCAPGNVGIAREAECVALDIADHKAVIDFCKENAVELVVVGPETPLVAGREFNERDTANAPYVAIVNESFARRHLNGAIRSKTPN